MAKHEHQPIQNRTQNDPFRKMAVERRFAQILGWHAQEVETATYPPTLQWMQETGYQMIVPSLQGKFQEHLNQLDLSASRGVYGYALTISLWGTEEKPEDHLEQVVTPEELLDSVLTLDGLT